MTRDDLKTAGLAGLLGIFIIFASMFLGGCSNTKGASLAQTIFDEQSRWGGGDGGSP